MPSAMPVNTSPGPMPLPGQAASETQLSDELLLRSAGLSSTGPALLDFFRKRSQPPAQRTIIDNLLRELGDDLIEILIERSAKFLSPMSMVLFFHLHGAAARMDRNATAFGLREDQWDYDVISQWTDPAESAGHIQWTRDFWTAVEPFATGEVYVNHLDAEEATRIRAAYGPGYERLVALKNKYDPTNLFRLNQNIKPTI